MLLSDLQVKYKCREMLARKKIKRMIRQRNTKQKKTSTNVLNPDLKTRGYTQIKLKCT